MSIEKFIKKLQSEDCFMVTDDIEVSLFEFNEDKPEDSSVSYWYWYDHNNINILSVKDFYTQFYC